MKKGDYSNVIVEGHAPGHTWSWPLPARLQKMYQNLDGTYGGNAIYVQRKFALNSSPKYSQSFLNKKLCSFNFESISGKVSSFCEW